ncbi:8-amino-7-oxononanoate synthase [Silvimonas terrae]|uniref:Putative 8-amino-7-oxononanoate synthase n=1 Tax=Silvimonas terrae TaxID=300266 RepID=A0A840RCI8_9NEIS|nr:aminotransferase class I/II-fold pyridoxal phosphate-dependent enzyme [Silvimonas terrae]MBB5191065.1 8-amino-7-oxononanoate synthase [Silvimonas terrae]
MIDFSTALYLGLTHPARQLGCYPALTTGTPASLAAAPLARVLAAQAAGLQGCEAGMAAPSTLHLAIDVFDKLARTHALIADESIYPIMRWGLERVMGMGVPVAWFRHADLADLSRHVRQRWGGRPPAIITDATRREGAPVQLARYLKLARKHGGVVVVDHSQVLGVLGEQPSLLMPWGRGGGGALRHAGLGANEPILLLASWSKAFGAPLATLCGPLTLISDLAREGPTQSHCSSASEAALRAGLNALALNRQHGGRLRQNLWQALRRLQQGLRRLARSVLPDLRLSRQPHPMQHLCLATAARTQALHSGLRELGIRTALLRQRDGRYAVAVIVRADHPASEIDALLRAMATVASRLPAVSDQASAGGRFFLEEREHV